MLTDGPGDSAFIMCIFCPPDSGKNAITNTSTPIPPTQCVKLRHISIDFGSASTSVKMDAPVVVKPETVSKSASINEGIAPDRKNGSAPKTDSAIQLNATITKPSRENRRLFCGFLTRISSPPIARQIPAETPNQTAELPSANTAQVISGTAIKAASKTKIQPRT